MSDTRVSFREMCERFGVTARTLRYYEYMELLSPERVGRSRFYGRREIARMTLIRRGRRFGFALEDIRRWLLLYDSEGQAAQMRVLVEQAEPQIENLDSQIRELTEARDALKALRDEVAKALD